MGTMSGGAGGAAEELVHIDADGVRLEGALAVPAGAAGIVLFAHGSGSSRLSPRNNYVAGVLRGEGLATLLFDLLTAEEDSDYERRFDIPLLATRLAAATSWVAGREGTGGLAIGYFGASTGAAAALVASCETALEVSAIVSRGGRPDLAGPYLARVAAPTLLVVGGLDTEVIELNRMAAEELRCEKEMAIVPGATHLFEEAGTLEEVAALAATWFKSHLG